MSLPNLIIPGAPKAGTTSITAILNEHPDFFMPSLKEPRFFIKEQINSLSEKDPLRKYLIKSSVLSWEDYQKLYSGIASKYRMDASIQYLFYYKTTIPLIKEYLGDPVILIILRDPVKRAFSNFKFNRATEPYENIIEAVEAELNGKKEFLNSFYHNYKQGLYADGVKAFLENFSQVKIVFYEDFLTDNLTFINDIFNDLGVCEISEIPKLPRLNSSAELTSFGNLMVGKFSPYNLLDKTIFPFVMSSGDRFQQRLKFKSYFLKKERSGNYSSETESFLRKLYKDDGVELKKILGIEVLPWER